MIKNVIFDIDGTLMNIDHRRKFVSGGKKNWKLFNEHIQFDTPNKIVFNMLDIFINDVKLGLENIYFVSGRKEKYRDITIKQICKYSCIDKIEIEDINLYMRDNKDFREDCLIKDDILKNKLNHIPIENLLVFDDRNSVVNNWRKKRITCFQVADGNF